MPLHSRHEPKHTVHRAVIFASLLQYVIEDTYRTQNSDGVVTYVIDTLIVMLLKTPF
jgi:hypothetical protein